MIKEGGVPRRTVDALATTLVCAFAFLFLIIIKKKKKKEYEQEWPT